MTDKFVKAIAFSVLLFSVTVGEVAIAQSTPARLADSFAPAARRVDNVCCNNTAAASNTYERMGATTNNIPTSGTPSNFGTGASNAQADAAVRAQREASERQAREQAQRAQQEAAQRAQQEAAQRAQREAAERQARETAERQAREVAQRRQMETANRQARETAQRAEREAITRRSQEATNRARAVPVHPSGSAATATGSSGSRESVNRLVTPDLTPTQRNQVLGARRTAENADATAATNAQRRADNTALSERRHTNDRIATERRAADTALTQRRNLDARATQDARRANERAATDRRASATAASERRASETAAAERRRATDQVATERRATERVSGERRAADERTVLARRQESDRIAGETAARERRSQSERLALDQRRASDHTAAARPERRVTSGGARRIESQGTNTNTSPDAVANAGEPHSVDFIVDGSGQTFPARGATGRRPTINENGQPTDGIVLDGMSEGANGQVASIRLMGPREARGNAPAYPNGVVIYENRRMPDRPKPQAVDPYTGRTVDPAAAHHPIYSRGE